MVDGKNKPGFMPLESEHIMDFIDGEHDDWTRDDFEAQALWLVVSARAARNRADKMQMLAEAQVWATLASSREE